MSITVLHEIARWANSAAHNLPQQMRRYDWNWDFAEGPAWSNGKLEDLHRRLAIQDLKRIIGILEADPRANNKGVK
jgi:hypothetical protein